MGNLSYPITPYAIAQYRAEAQRHRIDSVSLAPIPEYLIRNHPDACRQIEELSRYWAKLPTLSYTRDEDLGKYAAANNRTAEIMEFPIRLGIIEENGRKAWTIKGAEQR